MFKKCFIIPSNRSIILTIFKEENFNELISLKKVCVKSKQVTSLWKNKIMIIKHSCSLFIQTNIFVEKTKCVYHLFRPNFVNKTIFDLTLVVKYLIWYFSSLLSDIFVGLQYTFHSLWSSLLPYKCFWNN